MSLKNLITTTLVIVCLSRTGYSQGYGYGYGEDSRRNPVRAASRDALARQQLAQQRALAQQEARSARRMAAVERSAFAGYGQPLRAPAPVTQANSFWSGRKSSGHAYDARYASFQRPEADYAPALVPPPVQSPYRPYLSGDPRVAARPGATCGMGRPGGYGPVPQATGYANPSELGDGRYVGHGLFGQQRLFDRHQPVLNVLRYLTF